MLNHWIASLRAIVNACTFTFTDQIVWVRGQSMRKAGLCENYMTTFYKCEHFKKTIPSLIETEILELVCSIETVLVICMWKLKIDNLTKWCYSTVCVTADDITLKSYCKLLKIRYYLAALCVHWVQNDIRLQVCYNKAWHYFPFSPWVISSLHITYWNTANGI